MQAFLLAFAWVGIGFLCVHLWSRLGALERGNIALSAIVTSYERQLAKNGEISVPFSEVFYND